MFSFKVVTVVLLLAIVTAATCVPHAPAPDPDVPAMNAPNLDESTPADAYNNAQPSKRSDNDDRNDYDRYHYVRCDRGRGLYTLTSTHHNYYEDRWFDYACRNVTTEVASCSWTGYVNEFSEPILFMCPVNQYLAGVQSYHDNGPEDRRFRFYCCSPSTLKMHECFATDYLNAYDGYVSYTAPSDYVFTGMASVHSNPYGDRRYRIISCKVYTELFVSC